MNVKITVKFLLFVVLLTSAGGSFTAHAKAAEKKSSTSAKDKIVICIDAGHQSKANNAKEPIAPGSKTVKSKVSSGTQGVSTGKPEYKLNLEVALKLEQALQKDYKVVMVRRTNNVDISNSKRAVICNEAGADLAIRLHADGSEKRSTQGMSFLYPSSSNPSTKIIAQPSLEAAKVLSQTVLNETRAASRGIVPRSDLTGFNWSTVPVVLIEMGFMTNPNEDRKMSQAAYQDKIVLGIKKSLDSYYKDISKK